ncbi:DUF2920 family protein, partial [bacterium AH-315-E10]|nr:DUF2920 family protein [bacterium AH-315-E10]
VTDETGLMLSLHNWGGMGFTGAPDPGVLCKRYNVICIGVDYLQSGEGAPPESGFPYDTGYLQTLDALRGLFYVYHGLQKNHITFDATRLYATGGSGGGNVSLMANKLAPNTFACIVDLSGLASLTDDIAFGSPELTEVRAGYSRELDHPNYLSADAQMIRDPGCPTHIDVMMAAGNTALIVCIHGEDDKSCCVTDKRRVMNALKSAGADVQAHYMSQSDIDGDLIMDSGHGIGDRTHLLQHFADSYLLPDGPDMCRLKEPCNFESGRAVCFPTEQGEYVIDYSMGYPEAKFQIR